MPDNRQRGSAIKHLARAAQMGTFYRRTADEWSNLFGVSRQRFHQIRSLLRLPTRRVMIHRALTERLPWKARAQALWQVGIYNRRGDCWEGTHTQFNSSASINSLLSDLKGSKRRVLFQLRYGRARGRVCFDRPTCGHRWCIKPEHQIPVGIGVVLHRRTLPRAERVAAALEAGLSRIEIARREGIHPNYVSQINVGNRARGVRKKYPIRALLRRVKPGPKEQRRAQR